MKRVLIVAGDPSGDLIAAQLVASMKSLQPGLEVVGVGGRRLQAVSDRFLANIVERHALGFAITPGQIRYFRSVLHDIIEPELRDHPPDAVIPVDFYGFNSHVARTAKKRRHRIFYYASPQFWASRPWRAETLRPFVDMFLCLFPFEVDFYKKRGLPATFVGHPILDAIPKPDPNLRPKVESMIGLLPGSRPEEVRRHLPIMAKACDLIATAVPRTRFLLFTVPHIDRNLYQRAFGVGQPSKCLIELVQDEDYAWRSQLDLSISASGMETLENALLGVPMVVMYKTNWFTYAVARALIRIKHLAMPNLLAGKELVPEFIQHRATARNIAGPMIRWLNNPEERRILRGQLLDLREQFGDQGASERAARVILEKVA